MSAPVFAKALLRQRLGIIGRSGFGKTNAAKVAAEYLLADGDRVGIIDPTDSWYGLRLARDGKTPAHAVVIFGGDFGDLPLPPGSGRVIGQAVANAKESWIVSLADRVTESDRTAFCVDFLEALYTHNRAPLTLIVDEADTLAPQKPNGPKEATSVARMAQIVKRGRRRGFVPWLITQRPAAISKDVFSQVDALVAFSLTLPHDKRAVFDYVKEHDEDGSAARLFRDMPKLPRGEGILWHPGGNLLERRRFPLSATFDSGKTPEAGDRRASLKAIDVGAIGKAVASVVAEQAANDPAKLRARIAELERQALHAGAKVISAADAARERGEMMAAGARDALERVRGETAAALTNADVTLKAFAASIEKVRAIVNGKQGQHVATKAFKPTEYIREIDTYNDRGVAVSVAGPLDGAASRKPGRLEDMARHSTFGAGGSSLDGRPREGRSRLTPGQRSILVALAQLDGQSAPVNRVAAIAGMSPSSGTWSKYLGILRTAGYVDGLSITPAGRAALGAYEPLPIGAGALEAWKRKLTPAQGRMLQALADLGGMASQESVAHAADMVHTSGTWSKYLGQLRTLGLVEGRNPISLHRDLQP